MTSQREWEQGGEWEEIPLPDDLSDLRRKGLAKEINQKEKYAEELLCIAKRWLIFVAAIIFWSGASRVTTSSTPVSDGVLLALIGTSLGVVLAPASLIGGSLFKGKE